MFGELFANMWLIGSLAAVAGALIYCIGPHVFGQPSNDGGDDE